MILASVSVEKSFFMTEIQPSDDWVMVVWIHEEVLIRGIFFLNILVW